MAQSGAQSNVKIHNLLSSVQLRVTDDRNKGNFDDFVLRNEYADIIIADMSWIT